MGFSIFFKKIKLNKSWFRGAKRSRGFTLTELIVVMSIATVMMTILVISHNRWNDALVVNTQAYELALMIRQAQTYGLGVKEYTAGSGDKFNVGYGISINIDQPTQYVFFADKDKDKKYDSGEFIETKILDRGVVIDKICDVGSSGSETCGAGNANYRRLGVSFVRPEPQAQILFLNNGGNPTPGAKNTHVKIYLISPGDQLVVVGVRASGQVYVE